MKNRIYNVHCNNRELHLPHINWWESIPTISSILCEEGGMRWVPSRYWSCGPAIKACLCPVEQRRVGQTETQGTRVTEHWRANVCGTVSMLQACVYCELYGMDRSTQVGLEKKIHLA